MGFCLYTEGDNLGALNMYSHRPGAFTILKKSSQDNNVKLRDLARTVMETGKVPGTRR